MTSIPRQFRRPLIALAAIFVASLASEASACSAMKTGVKSCASVCECCSPEVSESPAAPVEVARPANVPQIPNTCQAAPGGNCVCRGDEPAAPAPKPARSASESRSDLGEPLDFVTLGDDAAARTTANLLVSPTRPPPKIPLYLRNSRLLF